MGTRDEDALTDAVRIHRNRAMFLWDYLKDFEEELRTRTYSNMGGPFPNKLLAARHEIHLFIAECDGWLPPEPGTRGALTKPAK